MARIGIAGAGIIGCATAVHLIEQGHDVTVFEKDLGGLPASVGNAGILAVPEIDPLARPDMILSAPKWLLDPLGPLTLRWQDLPALTPWLVSLLMDCAFGFDARGAGRTRRPCTDDRSFGPHDANRRADDLRQRKGG